MRQHRTWTHNETRMLRRMHRDGFSLRGIAIWLERDCKVVARQARRLGLEFDSRRICHAFTADDDRTIRINYPYFPGFLVAHVIGASASATHRRAVKLGVKKAPDFHTHPRARAWSGYDHPNSVASRIKPGSTPPNKGLRRPGYAPGRSATTQFKKGRPAGQAHNYVPIGTEKVDKKRNVLVRKMTDDPALFSVNRWTPVHRLVWEATHGPVPEGHIVRFRDGMKTLKTDEITLDRLELVTLRENMLRNTIHNYPPEIVQAVQMRGALTRAINRHQRSHPR